MWISGVSGRLSLIPGVVNRDFVLTCCALHFVETKNSPSRAEFCLKIITFGVCFRIGACFKKIFYLQESQKKNSHPSFWLQLGTDKNYEFRLSFEAKMLHQNQNFANDFFSVLIFSSSKCGRGDYTLPLRGLRKIVKTFGREKKNNFLSSCIWFERNSWFQLCYLSTPGSLCEDGSIWVACPKYCCSTCPSFGM